MAGWMKKLQVTGIILFVLAIFVGYIQSPSRARQEKVFLKEIYVEGKPYEMGYQQGEQCKELIDKEIKYMKEDYLPKIQKMMEQWKGHVNMTELWEKRSQYLENNLKEKAPELLEELKGIAKGSEKSYDDILFLNNMGEQCTCSAWAAFGKASKNGHSYLGFHADSDISSASYQIVVSAKPSRGNSFISIDMAGCIGSWAGMNDKGLASAWTTVGTSDEGDGTSPGILSRLILQYCDDIDQAIELADSNPRVFGANLLLVEKDSKAVVVEYTHSHINVREPIDCTLAVPSHFVSNEMNRYGPSMPRYPSSYYRYIRLEQLLYQNKGKIDMEVMKKIDQDHLDLSIGEIKPSPNTICRHDGPDTTSSILCGVTKGIVYIAKGYPCEGNYSKYKL